MSNFIDATTKSSIQLMLKLKLVVMLIAIQFHGQLVMSNEQNFCIASIQMILNPEITWVFIIFWLELLLLILVLLSELLLNKQNNSLKRRKEAELIGSKRGSKRGQKDHMIIWISNWKLEDMKLNLCYFNWTKINLSLVNLTLRESNLKSKNILTPPWNVWFTWFSFDDSVSIQFFILLMYNYI